MKAALKDARVPVPPEEAQAWRRCLHILAPLSTTHERKCMSTNIEKIINGTDNTLLAFHVADLGALYFPNDSVRGQALGRQMQAAVISGELASIVPDKQHVFISDLAAWPACPPISASSPLRYWLPFMPTTGLVEPVASPDEKPDDTLVMGPRATPLRNNLKTRINVLTAVINRATNEALESGDWQSVWATLVAIASRPDRPAPLLGYTEGEGVKYQTDKDAEPVAWLTREALRGRCRVMRKQRLPER